MPSLLREQTAATSLHQSIRAGMWILTQKAMPWLETEVTARGAGGGGNGCGGGGGGGMAWKVVANAQTILSRQ